LSGGVEVRPFLPPLIPAKAGTQSCYRDAGVSGFAMADRKRRRITQRSGSPLSRGCTEMWGNQAADTRRDYSLGTGMPEPPLTLSPDRSLRSRRLKPSPNG